MDPGFRRDDGNVRPADALVGRFADDLAALIATPTPASRLGVAVSGGPDSVALLLLAEAAFPRAIAAATVDHGLRPAAAGEARGVGDLCGMLGVPHTVLAGRVEPAGEGLQAAARAVRYRLLGEWAGREGLAALATAHHADDQAETFLMRAARGSGVAGLAGVRRSRPAAIPLVRPLLGWRHAELAAVVAAAGLVAADDPSNADERFDRVRFRRLLAATPALNPIALAASAGHLAEADVALDWMAARLWDERIVPRGDAALALDPAGLPDELLRRLLVKALLALDPGIAPRGAEVMRLAARLESGQAATLGAVKASPGVRWRFERAPPHRAVR